MSLYNMLFGVNKAAPVLLACIGMDIDDIPRFRDCFIEGENIVIHTRTGGGNRDFYGEKSSENDNGPWNTNMENNQYYLRDEDDSFDCTYANFYFKFPDEYAADLKALSEEADNYTPSEKWHALFKSMQAPIDSTQTEQANSVDLTDKGE